MHSGSHPLKRRSFSCVVALAGAVLYSPWVGSTETVNMEAPPANGYQFIGWEDVWGRGSAAETPGAADEAMGADYTNGPFNDLMSSFEICNNSGADHSYYVRLWKDTQAGNLIYAEHIEVANGECRVINILEINDQVTQVGISPSKL